MSNTKTVTKAQLIKAITNRVNNSNRLKNKMTLNTTNLVVSALFEEIMNNVATDQKVEFARFGYFIIMNRAARKGRNPKTGSIIDIAAKKMPVFKPSKNFKQFVNN